MKPIAILTNTIKGAVDLIKTGDVRCYALYERRLVMHNGTVYIIVTSEEQIRGMEFSGITYSHDAWMNRDYSELREQILERIR
jgi:hypothetical protein